MGPETRELTLGCSTAYEEALRIVAGREPRVEDSDVEVLVTVIGRLRDSSSYGRYLQGGLLALIRRDMLWQRDSTLGGGTWGEWCAGKIGLSYRACNMLIQIHERCVALGLDPARLATIGWRKSLEFLRVADQGSVGEWMAVAQDATVPELAERVREARRRGRSGPRDEGPAREAPEVEDARPFTVRLTKEVRANVEGAIEMACALIADRPGRTPSRAAGLDLVCLEWKLNHIDREEQSLRWFVAQLERHYGVRVVVAEAGDPELPGTVRLAEAADERRGTDAREA